MWALGRGFLASGRVSRQIVCHPEAGRGDGCAGTSAGHVCSQAASRVAGPPRRMVRASQRHGAHEREQAKMSRDRAQLLAAATPRRRHHANCQYLRIDGLESERSCGVRSKLRPVTSCQLGHVFEPSTSSPAEYSVAATRFPCSADSHGEHHAPHVSFQHVRLAML